MLSGSRWWMTVVFCEPQSPKLSQLIVPMMPPYPFTVFRNCLTPARSMTRAPSLALEAAAIASSSRVVAS